MSYKIPDSITAKVQKINADAQKKSKFEEIYKSLDAINSKFSVKKEDYPQNISLQKIEFERPTDEQIKKQVEQNLAEYKQNELNKIDEQFYEKSLELNKNKESAKTQTDLTKQNLDTYYKQAAKSAEDQALKRGLQRSSIIVNQLDAFSKEQIEDYKQLDLELGNQINSINFQLNALNAQKQNALNNFDISYAVKLQEQISKLNEDLQNKEQEVQKYNNDIMLKEAEFNKSLAEAKQKASENQQDYDLDIAELYGKYGSGIINKVKQEQLIATAKQFLNSLPKAEQAELLGDSTFIEKLGDVYDKLLREM